MIIRLFSHAVQASTHALAPLSGSNGTAHAVTTSYAAVVCPAATCPECPAPGPVLGHPSCEAPKYTLNVSTIRDVSYVPLATMRGDPRGVSHSSGGVVSLKPCPDGCTGNGNCNGEDGTCRCRLGWTGPTCGDSVIAACRVSLNDTNPYCE